MSMKKTAEGYVLGSILDYLAVQRIFAIRMNSGAIRDITGRPVRMHEPGTADVLALPSRWNGWDAIYRPIWIECKAPKGKQSLLQKEFEAKVKAYGHEYILAYGIEDLAKAGL